MYKVLVVDDEQIVCDAVRFIVSKREDNLVVCGAASSGREAIELTKVLMPDIIIMDIRMPGINGIDAIKEIKHGFPDMKFIIISAYEQFEFAKQAVQLGVKEYILKPINRVKLNQILDQLIDELESEQEQKVRDLETMERLYNMLPFLETGFIYSILTNSEAQGDMKKVIHLLDVTCDFGYLMVFQFHISDSHRQLDVFNTHLNLHEKSDLIREIIKYKCPAIVGPLMINKMVIFIPCKAANNDYDSRVASLTLAECLQSKIEEVLKINCSIGVSSVVGLAELYYAYGQANKAVCKTTDSEIFHIADLYEDHEWSRQKLKLQNQLMEALTQGRLEKALKYFDALYARIGEQKDSVFELVVLIFRIAHDEQIEENELLDFTSYLDELNAMDLKSDWYQWIIARMKYIATQIQDKKDHKCSVIVERTKGILKSNYTEELTLEGVARIQNISPQYLSKLFKEETSFTFVEFLTRLRIELAHQLMVESDLSIKEICYKVGYSDPNYFSRLFRKQTGLMPKTFVSQYRANKS